MLADQFGDAARFRTDARHAHEEGLVDRAWRWLGPDRRDDQHVDLIIEILWLRKAQELNRQVAGLGLEPFDGIVQRLPGHQTFPIPLANLLEGLDHRSNTLFGVDPADIAEGQGATAAIDLRARDRITIRHGAGIIDDPAKPLRNMVEEAVVRVNFQGLMADAGNAAMCRCVNFFEKLTTLQPMWIWSQFSPRRNIAACRRSDHIRRSNERSESSAGRGTPDQVGTSSREWVFSRSA